MSKKLVLDYIPDFDFLMYAIVSFDKDYKFAWELNSALPLDFERKADHMVYFRKSGKERFFPSFFYAEPENYLEYHLIGNKSDYGLFLDELKGIDYLLFVKGDHGDEFASGLLKSLKSLNCIQGVFQILPENLKAKNLLLDIFS